MSNFRRMASLPAKLDQVPETEAQKELLFWTGQTRLWKMKFLHLKMINSTPLKEDETTFLTESLHQFTTIEYSQMNLKRYGGPAQVYFTHQLGFSRMTFIRKLFLTDVDRNKNMAAIQLFLMIFDNLYNKTNGKGTLPTYSDCIAALPNLIEQLEQPSWLQDLENTAPPEPKPVKQPVIVGTSAKRMSNAINHTPMALSKSKTTKKANDLKTGKTLNFNTPARVDQPYPLRSQSKGKQKTDKVKGKDVNVKK